jgi:hypothetical protein
MKTQFKCILIVFLLSFSTLLSIKTTYAQDLIRGNEVGGPRDRINAFCDPAANPRELRGENIDCSGYTQPTSPPSNNNEPTSVPTNGGVPTSIPTQTQTNNPSNDDPCAAGKSYTGDYCGWSPPRIGGNEGNSTTTTSSSGSVPAVRGLSYTAGPDLAPSDIILLLGVLCLLLYVKSKIELKISR